MAKSMRGALRLKSLIVGSSLEPAAIQLRWFAQSIRRLRHPELWEIYQAERDLPKVVKRLLRTNSSAADVGAHIGSFLSVVLRVAPQGRHLAIEASNEKSAILRGRFPNVEVHGVAASDQDGTAKFQEYARHSGYSHLSRPPITVDEKITSYVVKTKRLDTIAAGRTVDLIKIDVEGHELQVLRGATETIKRSRPSVIFECGSEYALLDMRVSRRELYDFLTEGLDYSIMTFSDFLFDKGEMKFDEFRRCGLYPFRAFNFVALPRAEPNRRQDA
jgi:FkbM family methyltransferase